MRGRDTQRVLACMQAHCGLDEGSCLVDIGAGLGRPLLHALLSVGICSAWGVEIDSIKCLKAEAFLRQVAAVLRGRGTAPPDLVLPHIACTPIECLRTLDPATHAYSFWEGVPVDARVAFGSLFAASSTLRSVAVVQRSMRCPDPAAAMNEWYGFGALTLVGEFIVAMSGSGRQFVAYVFVRNEPHKPLVQKRSAMRTAPAPALGLFAAHGGDAGSDADTEVDFMGTRLPMPTTAADGEVQSPRKRHKHTHPAPKARTRQSAQYAADKAGSAAGQSTSLAGALAAGVQQKCGGLSSANRSLMLPLQRQHQWGMVTRSTLRGALATARHPSFGGQHAQAPDRGDNDADSAGGGSQKGCKVTLHATAGAKSLGGNGGAPQRSKRAEEGALPSTDTMRAEASVPDAASRAQGWLELNTVLARRPARAASLLEEGSATALAAGGLSKRRLRPPAPPRGLASRGQEVQGDT